MSHTPAAVRSAPRPIGRAVTVLLAIAVVGAGLAVASPARAAGGDGLRHEANERRTSRDLHPVLGTALLDDIADHRAAAMARANELEHDLTYVQHRLNKSGVCWKGYGEIIAWQSHLYDGYSYSRTMNMWWESPPHHAVIMTPDYNAAGGAWKAASDGDYYSVMVFVTLCGGDASSVPLLHPDDRYSPDRPLVAAGGRLKGYRFSSSGDLLGHKTVTLSKARHFTAAGRARVGGKAYLKVSSGPLAGYWVRESADAYVRGMTEQHKYDPDRKLLAERGRYTGRKFDRLGRVTDRESHRFAHRRTPRSSSLAIINGRRFYRFSCGPLDGFWVRDTASVYPR